MSVVNDLSKIAKVLREADKIEQYTQILDAMARMIEMQKRIGILEDELKELKENERVSLDLKFVKDIYWHQIEGRQDGPYCPRCWDVDKNLVHLSDTGTNFYKCHQDKSIYEK